MAPCRYSGIEVPDALWSYCTSGKDRKYSDNQSENIVREEEFMRAFDAWSVRSEAHVAAKGKVEPGRWRHWLRGAGTPVGRREAEVARCPDAIGDGTVGIVARRAGTARAEQRRDAQHHAE